MNERIKQLRKEMQLTQEEFAKQIGIKRNTLANYEIGRNDPIDAVVFSICREFNVNEEWLRNGIGEMFRIVPEEDAVASYVTDLLDDPDNPLNSIVIEIMHTYNQLDNKSKDVLKKYASMLLSNLSTKKEG